VKDSHAGEGRHPSSHALQGQRKPAGLRRNDDKEEEASSIDEFRTLGLSPRIAQFS
jgi:hypothetical protein